MKDPLEVLRDALGGLTAGFTESPTGWMAATALLLVLTFFAIGLVRDRRSPRGPCERLLAVSSVVYAALLVA